MKEDSFEYLMKKIIELRSDVDFLNFIVGELMDIVKERGKIFLDMLEDRKRKR